MTDARERLETAIRAALPSEYKHYSRLVSHITDAVERALAPEPSAPSPVWPGVEEADNIYMMRFNSPSYETSWEARCAGLAAVAPHLWRAMVASLPEVPDARSGYVWIGHNLVRRAALAALADPYDGGGKGVGK